MTDRPSFDDMRVEVTGSEVRLVFMANSPEHARRIARDVAAKIKAEKLIEEKQA
jgi:uncharacterized protein (UPF0212 family)